MIDAGLRVGLLVLVAGLAWLAVRGWERRLGAPEPGLPPGLVVITGPGCRLCDPVVRELRRAGAEPRILDIAEVPPGAVGASSLPVAMVVDAAGRVVLRRAGRAALDAARELAGAVAGV